MATTVLGEALKRLRQEYAAEGKESAFEALKPFLDPKDSVARPSYDEAAKGLQVTTGAVKILIYRLRKLYTALLRDEVGRTVSDPAEVDEEIHALLRRPDCIPKTVRSMSTKYQSTCLSCGNEFSKAMEFVLAAISRKYLPRSTAASLAQLFFARIAASTAWLTSAALLSGTCAISTSVAGLKTGFSDLRDRLARIYHR